MLGLKLNHVSKRGPCTRSVNSPISQTPNAPVPYPTAQQKCAYFCSDWCIVGYEPVHCAICGSILASAFTLAGETGNWRRRQCWVHGGCETNSGTADIPAVSPGYPSSVVPLHGAPGYVVVVKICAVPERHSHVGKRQLTSASILNRSCDNNVEF